MATMKIERVTALPGTLAGSTMYIVRSAEAGLAEVYFSNIDGTEARHVINKAEIGQMVSDAVGGFNNISLVADLAARNALAPTRPVIAWVLDATADMSVSSGAASYIYDPATTTWTKTSEFESMDLTLTWTGIQGRPTSTVEAIDAAVASAHSHANIAVLNLLTEGADGALQYNGAGIDANLTVAAW